MGRDARSGTRVLPARPGYAVWRGRRACVTLAVAVLAGVLVAAGATPAAAIEDEVGTPGDTRSAVAPAQQGGCTLYGNTANFGLDCVDGSRASMSLSALVAQAGIPACWHEPKPPEVTPPRELLPPEQEAGAQWYYRRCLEPNTQTGRLVVVTTELVALPPGQALILTAGQQAVIDRVERNGLIDQPQIDFTPANRVRVRAGVGVYTRTAPDTPVINAGGISMRARQTALNLQPSRGAVIDRASCSGTKQVPPGEPVARAADVCTLYFLRSSASQPGGNYRLAYTATWVIEYDTGDGTGWREFLTVDRIGQRAVRVSEITALVVP